MISLNVCVRTFLVFIIAWNLLPITPALANSTVPTAAIGLHLECEPGEANCQEYPEEPFGKIVVRIKPDIVLSPETLHEFYFTPDEVGREVASLVLTKAEAEKLKTLTTANLRKRLAIIIGGKVNSAPIIQSAIFDRMQIMFGPDGPHHAFKDVPWALEMAKQRKDSDERANLLRVISYLLIATALIGGPVYFAFIRGRKRNEEA